MGFGYWADSQFESEPVGLIIGTAIGFSAMLLRVVRMRPGDDTTQQDDNITKSTKSKNSESDR